MISIEDSEYALLQELKNKQFLLEQKNKIIDEHVFMTTSDLSGKITDISQAYLDFTGYTKEEVLGKNHRIFRNQSLDKSIIKNLWDTLLQNKTWIGELKNHKSTGEEYWIQTVIKPLYDIDNVKIGYTSVKEDITTKKRLEELSTKDQLTLLHNRRHFEYFVKKELNRSKSRREKIALMLIEIDNYYDYKSKYGQIQAHKLLLELSNTFKKQIKQNINIQEIFKISESEFAVVILNKEDSYIKSISDKLLNAIKKLSIECTQNDASKVLTISIGSVNLDTAIYDITSNDLYNITDTNLDKAKKQGGSQSVSEFDDKYIKNLKNIDNITKLPNRSALVNDLSALQSEAMLILLHINQINSLKDLYGFEFATNIILKKADELRQVLDENETSLYNLNLQEFAILITDKTAFDKYFLILKHSILMSQDSDEDSASNYVLADFTAGISYGVQNIFNHADLVLQEAIVSKVSYRTYRNNQSAKQLQEDNLSRLKIYKNALHTGKIIPYFQPIVDSTTTSIVKYEALARIETDDGEIISPYYFLDSAKEDKTFEFFTRQMMQKVFNVFAKNNVNISINLTYENINSETMIDYIKNRLEKYGGDGITFEILESEDILDYAIIETFIKMVKKYGCKVSIDDFGSGYSNFTNIIKLDIDYIKLDGSLIEKLNTDQNVRHMIKGLLVYAKNANLKTIAEFVSSKELAVTVKELGIDYIQGYYYGEPRPPEYYGLI
ncbi:bifunctional diguanylate cyclase/phosphodiesterase [Sulfurimonas sp.]